MQILPADVAILEDLLGLHGFVLLFEPAQFLSKKEVVDAGGDDNTQGRFPTEVQEHEANVPAPDGRDHDDRRCGEVRQRSARGDIDEQQPNGGVLEFLAGAHLVELVGQQQRANGHRRRLGDQRTQQRPANQNSQPPGLQRAAEQTGDLVQDLLAELQDGARGGQNHDDHHEHRLCVVRPVGDVVDRRVPAIESHDGPEEDHGPQAERGLDHPQKAEYPGPQVSRISVHLAFSDLLLVGALPLVRRGPEPAGNQGVDNSAEEDESAYQVEWLLGDAVEQNLSDAGRARVVVPVQFGGKLRSAVVAASRMGRRDTPGYEQQSQPDSPVPSHRRILLLHIERPSAGRMVVKTSESFYGAAVNVLYFRATPGREPGNRPH